MASSLFDRWADEAVSTPYGRVTVLRRGSFVFLQRHGAPPIPPHRIDHRANIWALKNCGVRRIFSINSVGSLKTAIEPGMLLIPDDFLSIWHIPTFFDDEMRFMVPEMDGPVRSDLAGLCDDSGIDVISGGIYIQTLGPRLETKAEITFLKNFGHVIGMTMASEATLSMEYRIPYASLCSIDNYCNGIATTPLTMEEIAANVTGNMKKIEKVIGSLISKEPT